jgi:hypothetical protein
MRFSICIIIGRNRKNDNVSPSILYLSVHNCFGNASERLTVVAQYTTERPNALVYSERTNAPPLLLFVRRVHELQKLVTSLFLRDIFGGLVDLQLDFLARNHTSPLMLVVISIWITALFLCLFSLGLFARSFAPAIIVISFFSSPSATHLSLSLLRKVTLFLSRR